MGHLVAVNRVVVLADQVVGHSLGLHSSKEGDEQHDEHGSDDHDQSGVANSFVEVTVFPNDIRGLRSLCNFSINFRVAISKIKLNRALFSKDVVCSFRLDRDESTLRAD